MVVITISRELGSDGDAIARQVAETLGYRFVDKSFIGKVLSQYGLVEFDKEYDILPTFWEKFNAQKEERREIMVDMLNRVVRAVAQPGKVVILGRSGFAILGGFDDVLNVRIQAPFWLRVKKVMVRKNITAYQAEDIVRQGDQVRSAFVKSFYGLQWDTASAFDLIINTGKISPDLAAQWIISVSEARLKKDVFNEPTIGLIQVDPILLTAISNELAKLETAT
jgi:cytidylate kinase